MYVLIAVVGIGIGTLIGVMAMTIIQLAGQEDTSMRETVLVLALIRLVWACKGYGGDEEVGRAVEEAQEALGVS